MSIMKNLVLGCLLLPGIAVAQEVDPEWPCVQRLVEQVSPAIMWPVPVDESASAQWRKDPDIRELAEMLGDIETYGEAEQARVAAFADAVPEEQKEVRLTLLAAGIVEVTNRVRSHYISGIKRYTHQQIAIADQVEDALNELSVLGDSSDPDAAAKREEITTTLTWHERVYDQREQAIRSLCEQPVELEETLSTILRDLAQYLP